MLDFICTDFVKLWGQKVKLTPNLLRGEKALTLVPHIFSRDSFIPWTWARIQTAHSIASLVGGVGLNFDPIEFLPVGSWFNGLFSGFNGVVMLHCDPPRQGVIVLRPLRRIKCWTPPPLNCDPGSWFYVELWLQVLFPRWILTLSHNSTLNYDLGLGSQFSVEFWPGIIIQRGIWPGVIIPRWILILGNNSTLNFDPGS